jgi:hypothetical protein
MMEFKRKLFAFAMVLGAPLVLSEGWGSGEAWKNEMTKMAEKVKTEMEAAKAQGSAAVVENLKALFNQEILYPHLAGIVVENDTPWKKNSIPPREDGTFSGILSNDKATGFGRFYPPPPGRGMVGEVERGGFFCNGRQYGFGYIKRMEGDLGGIIIVGFFCDNRFVNVIYLFADGNIGTSAMTKLSSADEITLKKLAEAKLAKINEEIDSAIDSATPPTPLLPEDVD